MNKPLVLVVEDDRPIRNLIVTTLKAHDYHYLTAENVFDKREKTVIYPRKLLQKKWVSVSTQ